jgi:hypothetical protein
MDNTKNDSLLEMPVFEYIIQYLKYIAYFGFIIVFIQNYAFQTFPIIEFILVFLIRYVYNFNGNFSLYIKKNTIKILNIKKPILIKLIYILCVNFYMIYSMNNNVY